MHFFVSSDNPLPVGVGALTCFFDARDNDWNNSFTRNCFLPGKEGRAFLIFS